MDQSKQSKSKPGATLEPVLWQVAAPQAGAGDVPGPIGVGECQGKAGELPQSTTEPAAAPSTTTLDTVALGAMLARLRSSGVQIWTSNNEIKIKGFSLIPAEAVYTLRQHKPAIIAILKDSLKETTLDEEMKPKPVAAPRKITAPVPVPLHPTIDLSPIIRRSTGPSKLSRRNFLRMVWDNQESKLRSFDLSDLF